MEDSAGEGGIVGTHSGSWASMSELMMLIDSSMCDLSLISGQCYKYEPNSIYELVWSLLASGEKELGK